MTPAAKQPGKTYPPARSSRSDGTQDQSVNGRRKLDLDLAHFA
jgi:hypothetical protein